VLGGEPVRTGFKLVAVESPELELELECRPKAINFIEYRKLPTKTVLLVSLGPTASLTTPTDIGFMRGSSDLGFEVNISDTIKELTFGSQRSTSKQTVQGDNSGEFVRISMGRLT
jgi:hypothetical protein